MATIKFDDYSLVTTYCCACKNPFAIKEGLTGWNKYIACPYCKAYQPLEDMVTEIIKKLDEIKSILRA